MRLKFGMGLFLAMLGLVVPAQASPILAGVINGIQFCATDNNTVCSNGIQLTDVNGTAGVLQLDTTTLAGVTVSGSLHTSAFGPPQDSLNSSSLSIINNTANSIAAQVAIGGTSYTAPITSIQSSGSGTWQNALGSTIAMSWFASTANIQGANTPGDLPGTLLASFGTTAGVGVDSFATPPGGFFTPFVANSPFSMTLGFSMNLISGGSLISRGQNEIASVTPAAVPEPGSMLLLGTGLLAAARRFKKRQA